MKIFTQLERGGVECASASTAIRGRRPGGHPWPHASTLKPAFPAVHTGPRPVTPCYTKCIAVSSNTFWYWALLVYSGATATGPARA